MLPTGPYPYAGVPWFNTPFGRDGLITAFECLWMEPSLARGVLAYLAATQAAQVIPEQDAEPGKILHETRNGEMAALKGMPFARYYGSVDDAAFCSFGEYLLQRTGNRKFIHEIWPNIRSGSAWMHRYGDRDGDGFIEYSRQSHDGLVHQGWKDSDDAIFHADGSLARGPIALCELQSYAYAAWRAGAALASALGYIERSGDFLARAERLRARFDSAFWCDDLGTYALALDGDKRPCRVRASDTGQCLFSGIVPAERTRTTSTDSFGSRVVLWFGRPHGSILRAAIQSDGLSQRRCLAARQCADSVRAGALWNVRRSVADFHRVVRHCHVPRPAPGPRIVLWISTRPR